MRHKPFLAGILILVAVYSLIGCSTMPNEISQSYPQDANIYLKNIDAIIVSPEQQRLLAQDYLIHYFSPWTGQQRILTDQAVLQAEIEAIVNLRKAPGYAVNQQPHSQQWVADIATNMDLAHFPNQQRKAITIQPAYIRYLPIMEPTFSALAPAWENYPFDNFQTSFMPANTPVLVLHTTQDHAWLLVLVHNVIGWIPSYDVAYVNEAFMQRWQAQQWVAPLRDNVSVMTRQNYHFKARLGMLLPLVKANAANTEVLVAVADQNQQAVIKHAYLAEQDTAIFPLLATKQNFANLINSQLGKPYGWGGLYGYRDCSAFIEDLLTPFGIWLPRNSKDQAALGHFINLKGLSTWQKQQVLLNKGVPLLTLIRLPGHVMLYLAPKDGHAVVVQSAWGLHTQNWLTGKEGRLVLGKTFIVPIDYDESAFNSQSMLARANSLAVLDKSRVD